MKIKQLGHDFCTWGHLVHFGLNVDPPPPPPPPVSLSALSDSDMILL